MTIILEGGYFFIRDDSEPCTWMYHAGQMIFVINSGRHGNCQEKIWASRCICIQSLILGNMLSLRDLVYYVILWISNIVRVLHVIRKTSTSPSVRLISPKYSDRYW